MLRCQKVELDCTKSSLSSKLVSLLGTSCVIKPVSISWAVTSLGGLSVGSTHRPPCKFLIFHVSNTTPVIITYCWNHYLQWLRLLCWLLQLPSEQLIILGVLITCLGVVIKHLAWSNVREEAFRLTVESICPSWWGKQVGDTPIYSDGKMRLLG